MNPSIDDTRESEILIHGARIQQASARIFTQPDIRAHNNFDHPNTVKSPQTVEVEVKDGKIVVAFPPASVNAMVLEL